MVLPQYFIHCLSAKQFLQAPKDTRLAPVSFVCHTLMAEPGLKLYLKAMKSSESREFHTLFHDTSKRGAWNVPWSSGHEEKTVLHHQCQG